MSMLASRHSTSNTLDIRRPEPSSSQVLLLADAVSAGFPSPAQDCQEGTIDLNRELISHPESTFCVRVRGESMIDADLHTGDILVVDRGLAAGSGSIAVCMLDGEFLVKRLHLEGARVTLLAENPAYPPQTVRPGQDFEVWGVVTWAIRNVLRR